MRDFDPVESLAAIRHEFGEYGGVNMSVETSTTFTVMRASTLPAIFEGQRGPEGGCYLYGRHFNPTVFALSRQIAALEGAEAAYCTASGMSAIAATLLQLCDHGDRIVASDTIYGGSFALLKEFLPAKCGLEVAFVDTADPDAVEEAMDARTRVLYVETMSNPMLRVADIPRLAAIAHARGARLVVDNTFCPLVVAPLRLGADVVVHSLTKFVNGASDAIAGAVCGSTGFVHGLMDLHKGAVMLLGPTMDPRVANEMSLRLPHLGLRMAEHSRRALVFATRLRGRGLSVIYPGLPDHPDHDVLRRIGHEAYGAGGVLSLDVGSSQKAAALMEILQNRDRFGYMAVSLGYFDTLMTSPASTTSSELSDDELRRAGISPGLVRISVGYTGSVEQRWRQLDEALEIVGLGHRTRQPIGG
jgi:methionine-gamma-lyase